MRLVLISLVMLVLVLSVGAQVNYQNPITYDSRYAYTSSPYYDASTNWQRGYLGPYYMPGLKCYPGQGCEAATYPPQYGTAKYNPYADDNNFALYQQTEKATREFLKANSFYDNLNYPAKQQAYMDFFARTDPRYYWMWTPVMYPYGKKPYYKTYGTNPNLQGTITQGLNPFWGFMYVRGLSCHGPNYGCEVHNIFPDST